MIVVILTVIIVFVIILPPMTGRDIGQEALSAFFSFPFGLEFLRFDPGLFEFFGCSNNYADKM